MLVKVARSSIDIARTAAPQNSNTLPTPRPCFSGGSANRCSTTSLAVTPAGSGPEMSTRSESGIVRRAAPVTKALAMSVVPTP